MTNKIKKNNTSKAVKPDLKNNRISGNSFSLIALVIITFFCFSGALKNELTNWDDQQYIIDNPLVKSLSGENIIEIFSNNIMGNYHPLAVLSFAIDYNLFQLNPKGFHATSILIHLLNVILIFIFFRLLTGQVIVAFLTAMLFGIHPMHVESVAWVSERKDVLYTFFYLAALCTYIFFIKKQKRKWLFYGLTFLFFAFSLLSKGQAVTFPVVLLLIDYLIKRKFDKKILFEKIPFFIVSIAMGIVAITAQKESGAITEIPLFPLFDRILFASYAFLDYMLKLLLPVNLSAFYPYPIKVQSLYPLIFYASPLILLVLVVLFFRFIKNYREYVFGLAFFIVNIILLLQLLPVGGSIMSERYTYLSYTGLFFVVGNAFSKVWHSPSQKISKYKYFFAFILTIYIFFLGYSTINRIKIWKNSETLWTDVIKKNPAAVIAYGNRGSYYQKQGKLDLAMRDFNEALRLKPDHPETLINRSDIYRINGQYNLSIADCNKALEAKNNYSGAYMNRGIAYCIVGRYDEAFSDFGKVISQDPKNANVYCNRGNLYDIKGFIDSAISDYSMAIKLQPEYAEAFYNRGKSFLRKQDYLSAINDFTSALNYNQKYIDAYFFRSQAFKAINDFAKALQDALTAQQLGKAIDENYIRELQNILNK